MHSMLHAYVALNQRTPARLNNVTESAQTLQYPGKRGRWALAAAPTPQARQCWRTPPVQKTRPCRQMRRASQERPATIQGCSAPEYTEARHAQPRAQSQTCAGLHRNTRLTGCVTSLARVRGPPARLAARARPRPRAPRPPRLAPGPPESAPGPPGLPPPPRRVGPPTRAPLRWRGSMRARQRAAARQQAQGSRQGCAAPCRGRQPRSGPAGCALTPAAAAAAGAWATCPPAASPAPRRTPHPRAARPRRRRPTPPQPRPARRPA